MILYSLSQLQHFNFKWKRRYCDKEIIGIRVDDSPDFDYAKLWATERAQYPQKE
jgi:hypothetical protein